MDILEAHSNTWGRQWKAGDPLEFQATAAAVRELLKKIAEAGNGSAKTIYLPGQIREVARRFKKSTSTGTDH